MAAGDTREGAPAGGVRAGDPAATLSEFERGVVAGILIGEGSFGGDGKQPQVTLRMHVRHEALFRWLQARFPRTRVYGPYGHGGRSYFQWMARGEVLVRDVLPVLEASVDEELDAYAAGRLAEMCDRYADVIGRLRARGRGLGREGGGELRDGGEPRDGGEARRDGG